MTEQSDGLDPVWGEFFDEAVKRSDSKASEDLLKEIDELNAQILALLDEIKQLNAEYEANNLGASYGITPKMAELSDAIKENVRIYNDLSTYRHELAQEWASLGHSFPGLPPLLTSGSDAR